LLLFIRCLKSTSKNNLNELMGSDSHLAVVSWFLFSNWISSRRKSRRYFY